MKQLKSCYDINDTVNYCIASVPCKFQLRSELAGVKLHHILGPDTRGLLALLTCSDGCGTGAGGHHHPDTRHLHAAATLPDRNTMNLNFPDNIEACYGCGLRRGWWHHHTISWHAWHGETGDAGSDTGRDDNICTGSPSPGHNLSFLLFQICCEYRFYYVILRRQYRAK